MEFKICDATAPAHSANLNLLPMYREDGSEKVSQNCKLEFDSLFRHYVSLFTDF